MNNNKSFAAVAALVAVIALALWVWFVVSRRTALSPGSTPLPAPSPVAQEPPPTASSSWQVYQDPANGFEVKYPTGITYQKQERDTYFSFPGDKVRIYVRVADALSVPPFGTFGGWYQYDKAGMSAGLVSTATIGDFTADYFVRNGGMGSWDRAITAYQAPGWTGSLLPLTQ